MTISEYETFQASTLSGRAGTSAGKRREARKEAERRRRMQQKAVFRFYSLDDGRRSFDDILRRILKRWPRSAASTAFIGRLRQLYDREARERQRYCEQLERRRERAGVGWPYSPPAERSGADPTSDRT